MSKGNIPPTETNLSQLYHFSMIHDPRKSNRKVKYLRKEHPRSVFASFNGIISIILLILDVQFIVVLLYAKSVEINRF